MNAVRIGFGGASVMGLGWLRTPRQTLLIGAFTAEAHVILTDNLRFHEYR